MLFDIQPLYLISNDDEQNSSDFSALRGGSIQADYWSVLELRKTSQFKTKI